MQAKAVKLGAGADDERAELLIVADMCAAERAVGGEMIGM